MCAAPAAAAPAEEKTDFTIKLEGFDAAAKIKVIKEVRGITDLGLKEAKDLVRLVWCICSFCFPGAATAGCLCSFLHLTKFILNRHALQVESSPAVLKKGVSKDEAEQIKAKLEAGTCTSCECFSRLRALPTEMLLLCADRVQLLSPNAAGAKVTLE